MPRRQLSLVPNQPSAALPEGFAYHPEAISPDDERRVLAGIVALPFEDFQFMGYAGKRRVVSLGWRYDFDQHKALPAEPVPPLFRDLCREVERTSGFAFGDPEQVLVTEYAPGAPIGWHKDRPVFGSVMGLSLAAPCTFRFRKAAGQGKWQRVSLLLEPRSAYLLSGDARWGWEHSIPPVDLLRYSVTFRTLRKAVVA